MRRSTLAMAADLGAKDAIDRAAARLARAGASRHLEVVECEHGFTARTMVTAGRASVPVEAHGHGTVVAAVEALVVEVRAVAKRARR